MSLFAMGICSSNHSHSRREFLQRLAAIGVGALVLGVPVPTLAKGSTESLQARVDAYVKGLRRSGRVTPDEATSWSVYDFTGAAKLVAINEGVPRQAASMIKPFVAQAYFYRHQNSPSKYPYTAEVEQLMARMICHSSNTATNELIARSSTAPRPERPREVERVLRQNAPDVFQQVSIVEYIPGGGRTYRNRASALDYSRFLHAMWNERLPSSEEMKHLLGLPNRDRIRQGTDCVPASTQVFDKTGSTAHLCGNMGIVVARGRDGKRYPYTMIGIIEKQNPAPAYGPWIRDRGNVIREVSDLVYAELKQRYNLV